MSPGVIHTEFVVRNPEGRSEGDLLNVNLKNTSVSTDLLFPGAVAARDEVSDMAEKANAVAAVNGDFFDIGETNAPRDPPSPTVTASRLPYPTDRTSSR